MPQNATDAMGQDSHYGLLANHWMHYSLDWIQCYSKKWGVLYVLGEWSVTYQRPKKNPTTLVTGDN